MEMENDKTTVFFIEARTGCTCCSSENHYRGPYRDRESAERRIQFYRTGDFWPLASQYAKRGSYSVAPATCETLPDGRVILGGGGVFPALSFIEVDADGRVFSNDAEWFGEEIW